MSDLIDRCKLVDYIMESYPDWCVKPVRPIFDFINGMPSVDAVEVVRCADCKHCQVDNLFDNYWCDGQSVWADHYCSKGERR